MSDDAIERWSEHARGCATCGSEDRGTCAAGRPLLAAAARADEAAEVASAKLAERLRQGDHSFAAPEHEHDEDGEPDEDQADEPELDDGPKPELLGRLQALSLADASKGTYAVTIQVEVEHANDQASCSEARAALTRLAIDLVRFYRLPLALTVQP